MAHVPLKVYPSIAARMTASLATVLQVQPWTVAGNCFTVKSKWDTVFEILKTNEQVKLMFINKTESCIRSYYELLVKSKRASNAAALKEPGVPPPQLSDEEAQIVRCHVQYYNSIITIRILKYTGISLV